MTHERVDSRHCSCGYGFASESHLMVHLTAQETIGPPTFGEDDPPEDTWIIPGLIPSGDDMADDWLHD